MWRSKVSVKNGSQTTCGSWAVEQVHRVVARSTFRIQNVENKTCSCHFWTLKHRFVWQAQGDSAPCQKWGKHEGFVASPKTMAGMGHFWRGSAKMHFVGKRNTRDMLIRDVRRSARWFPERGCILEHQIFRFAKMILRDRCSTSSDLAALFRGSRTTLETWTGKIAWRIGTRPSALHSTFHFWRKSCRIAAFSILSSLKTEEVSQSSFVFKLAARPIER